MTTVARPTTEASCHWYYPDGRSCYEVPRASGEGMRPTTLADARKLSLLPSVTTILNVLRKPQLETWLQEQACLAVLTTPRSPEEPLDAFVERVLHTERQQDQESDIAKKRGTEIHDALEDLFSEKAVSSDMEPWIDPAYEAVRKFLPITLHTEIILVGDGYAGKSDLIALDQFGDEWVVDFKTTKRIPKKESHWEHKMQTAAYSMCRRGLHHCNVYISTVDQGKFEIHDNGTLDAPAKAFVSLLNYWQVANNYHP